MKMIVVMNPQNKFAKDSNSKEVVNYIVEKIKKERESSCLVYFVTDLNDSNDSKEDYRLIEEIKEAKKSWDNSISKTDYGSTILTKIIKVDCDFFDDEIEVEFLGFNLASSILVNAILLQQEHNSKINISVDLKGCSDISAQNMVAARVILENLGVKIKD